MNRALILEKIISVPRAIALSLAIACGPSAAFVQRTYTGSEQQQQATAYGVVKNILQVNCHEYSMNQDGFSCAKQRFAIENNTCNFQWDEIEDIAWTPMHGKYIISVVKVDGKYDSCNIACYGNQEGIDLADAIKVYVGKK